MPNRLFRTWKLGEKKAEHGVLLLVAPTEHKARIEVGYGLEGDADRRLVQDHHHQRDDSALQGPTIYQGGIERGVDDVIAVLSTDSAEWKKRPDMQARQEDSGWAAVLPFIIVIGFIILVIYMGPPGRGGGIVFLPSFPTAARAGVRDRAEGAPAATAVFPAAADPRAEVAPRAVGSAPRCRCAGLRPMARNCPRRQRFTGRKASLRSRRQTSAIGISEGRAPADQEGVLVKDRGLRPRAPIGRRLS